MNYDNRKYKDTVFRAICKDKEKLLVYNINPGYNQALLEASETLRGYSIFVEKVRKYIKEMLINSDVDVIDMEKDELAEYKKNITKAAVTKAVDECIEEGILADFFRANREEAIDMSIAEYSFQKHIDVVREDSIDIGYRKAKDEDAIKLAEMDNQLADMGNQLAEKDKIIAELRAQLAESKS